MATPCRDRPSGAGSPAPAPMESLSVTWMATVGFTFMAWTFDLVAWKRPIQSVSQSVSRPKGTLKPTPTHTRFGDPCPRGSRWARESNRPPDRPRVPRGTGKGTLPSRGDRRPRGSRVREGRSDADGLHRRHDVPALRPREGRRVEVDGRRVPDARGLARVRVAETAGILLDQLEARREDRTREPGAHRAQSERRTAGTEIACLS